MPEPHPQPVARPVRTPFLVALVLTVIGGAAAGWYWYQKWQPSGDGASPLRADVLSGLATETAEVPVVPRFILTDQFGQPFDTASIRGRYWIITFGSAAPSDAQTPVISANLAALQARLTTDLADAFYMLTITNRPSADTPEAWSALATSVGASADTWRFLSAPGDAAKAEGIRKLARDIINLPAPRLPQGSLPGDAGDVSGSDDSVATSTDATAVAEPIVDPGTIVLTDPRGRVLNWFGGLDPRELEALERNLRSHREAVAAAGGDATETPPVPAAPERDRGSGSGRGFPFPFGGN